MQRKLAYLLSRDKIPAGYELQVNVAANTLVKVN